MSEIRIWAEQRHTFTMVPGASRQLTQALLVHTANVRA